MTKASRELPDPSLQAIDCRELFFSFTEGAETVLQGVNLQLEQGSRCLLVGANGGTIASIQAFQRWALTIQLENPLCCGSSLGND